MINNVNCEYCRDKGCIYFCFPSSVEILYQRPCRYCRVDEFNKWKEIPRSQLKPVDLEANE